MPTVTFKLPKPVLIGVAPRKGEPDSRISYSLADMVRHFQRRAREYNHSMDAARQGQRTLDAIENAAKGEVALDANDCGVLKALVEKPRCGWIDARAKQTIVVAPSKPGVQAETQTVLRRIEVSAATFIAFADAIPKPAE